MFKKSLIALALVGAVSSAQAATVLLSTWSGEGNGDPGGVWDNSGVGTVATYTDTFCLASCGGAVTAGDLSDISAAQFFPPQGKTANDDLGEVNRMLAYEGLDPVTGGVKTDPWSGFTWDVSRTGYVTIKAAGYVYLWQAAAGDTITITGQNGISHVTEWGAPPEVPLPGTLGLLGLGLVGLGAVRRRRS